MFVCMYVRTYVCMYVYIDYLYIYILGIFHIYIMLVYWRVPSEMPYGIYIYTW